MRRYRLLHVQSEFNLRFWDQEFYTGQLRPWKGQLNPLSKTEGRLQEPPCLRTPPLPGGLGPLQMGPDILSVLPLDLHWLGLPFPIHTRGV